MAKTERRRGASRGRRGNLTISGPRLGLRYPEPQDAGRLFELAADPEVTRFFSWGPYTDPAEPRGFIERVRERRESGEALELVVVEGDAAIGVTGLTEFSRRDRRAIVGTWLGRHWWGSGANFECKALVLALAFGPLGLNRVTALCGVGNGRSAAALARLGFRREGVLDAYHIHYGEPQDVIVFGMLRAEWEASELARVPVEIAGGVPAAFVVAKP